MSQAAKVGALTEQLVQSVVDAGGPASGRAFQHAKETALRGLRSHQYARPDPFGVRARLAGLDEKFRIMNRDDLADALRLRLDQLENARSKLAPDYLHLMLQLSDQPVANARVEALGSSSPRSEDAALTWADILREEPLVEEGIWETIDYAAASSEEDWEPIASERREETETPLSTSSGEEKDDPLSAVLTVNDNLREIEDAQFWKHPVSQERGMTEVTELLAVRETLFMLAGLPTSLYSIDEVAGSVRVVKRYHLNHASPETTHLLLAELAEFGRHLYQLRLWSRKKASLPLLQSFEVAVQARLVDFDRYLASLHQRYMTPEKQITVSLLDLHHQAQQSSLPLLELAKVVTEIAPSILVNPFAHLEALYDRINLAQATGDAGVLTYFAHIFFECLQTYLRPIRLWMESGELQHDDQTFFVFEADRSGEASSLWHDRFALRKRHVDAEALHCPSFLEPAAQRIFDTGKSRVFLKELGIRDDALPSMEQETPLDYDAVCGGSALHLSPFVEAFASAFDAWIRSKHSRAANMLRSHLLSEGGLLKALDALFVLHLSADGGLFQDFSDAMFDRIDSTPSAWNDRFLLTELAQGIYTPCLGPRDASRIKVRTSNNRSSNRSVKALRGVCLDYSVRIPTDALT